MRGHPVLTYTMTPCTISGFAAVALRRDAVLGRTGTPCGGEVGAKVARSGVQPDAFYAALDAFLAKK